MYACVTLSLSLCAQRSTFRNHFFPANAGFMESNHLVIRFILQMNTPVEPFLPAILKLIAYKNEHKV